MNRHIKDAAEINTGLSVYDLNKQIIGQKPAFNPEQLEEFRDKVDEWVNHESIYMLLCRDINYYTMFVPRENEDKFSECLIDCLIAVTDEILDYEVTDDSIEIWVRYEGEAMCMMLFNYDKGVVYYA